MTGPQAILDEFDSIRTFAEENQKCKRKAVGCSICSFEDMELVRHARSTNGPARPGHECTNVVGNCGCAHAEPRSIMSVLKMDWPPSSPLILFCTYSPCTYCANVILDSGIIQGCVYEILTEHDVRGASFLKSAMPVLTRQDLESVLEHERNPRELTIPVMETVNAAFNRWNPNT